MALSDSVLEGSPDRGCAPVAALESYVVFVYMALPFKCLLFFENLGSLCGGRGLDFVGNCPHESTKFSGYCGHNDLLGLALGPQTPVAGA